MKESASANLVLTLPRRTILKQLGAIYFLSAPVLSYFVATSFHFATNNLSLRGRWPR